MRDCSLLSIKNLNKEYAQNANKHIIAIKDISFQLNRGEFVSIVGPSGCGKTTLLMCIAGLMEASGGKILLNEKEVKTPPKEIDYY